MDEGCGRRAAIKLQAFKQLLDLITCPSLKRHSDGVGHRPPTNTAPWSRLPPTSSSFKACLGDHGDANGKGRQGEEHENQHEDPLWKVDRSHLKVSGFGAWSCSCCGCLEVNTTRDSVTMPPNPKWVSIPRLGVVGTNPKKVASPRVRTPLIDLPPTLTEPPCPSEEPQLAWCASLPASSRSRRCRSLIVCTQGPFYGSS